MNNIHLAALYIFALLEVVSPIIHIWISTIFRCVIEQYNNNQTIDAHKVVNLFVRGYFFSLILCVADHLFLNILDLHFICGVLYLGTPIWCIGIAISSYSIKECIARGKMRWIIPSVLTYLVCIRALGDSLFIVFGNSN